jgi:hypothetical protein
MDKQGYDFWFPFSLENGGREYSTPQTAATQLQQRSTGPTQSRVRSGSEAAHGTGAAISSEMRAFSSTPVSHFLRGAQFSVRSRSATASVITACYQALAVRHASGIAGRPDLTAPAAPGRSCSPSLHRPSAATGFSGKCPGPSFRLEPAPEPRCRGNVRRR